MAETEQLGRDLKCQGLYQIQVATVEDAADKVACPFPSSHEHVGASLTRVSQRHWPLLTTVTQSNGPLQIQVGRIGNPSYRFLLQPLRQRTRLILAIQGMDGSEPTRGNSLAVRAAVFFEPSWFVVSPHK